MMKHRQVGHVTAVVTDCEPSIVRAGRLLEAKKLKTHMTAQVIACSRPRGFYSLVTK